MKISVMLTLTFILQLSLIGGDMKTLSFYTVKYTGKKPLMDGKLDDGVWQNIPAYSDYYEYWKPKPGPSKTKTSFKMCYSDNGIYLGIINYEKNLKAIRANFTTWDSEKLWQDDCNEIYFDSFGDGVGYTKFVVNSLANGSDLKRLDAAISLADWSGSGWQVTASKSSDAWIVECFFPWADLGGKAEPGKIWRFCNTRYAYTSGKFIGSTSAPGGNYNQPGNFGYLYFVRDETLTPKKIGDILSNKVAPPWLLPLQDDLISCNAPGKSKIETLESVFKGKMKQVNKLKNKINTLQKHIQDSELEKQLKKLTIETGNIDFKKDKMNAIRRISELAIKFDNIYWKLKVIKLVESNVKP